MKISHETVDNLAKLSRLSFEGDAKESMRVDLENILDMCEKLKDVNTDGVDARLERFFIEGIHQLFIIETPGEFRWPERIADGVGLP